MQTQLRSQGKLRYRLGKLKTEYTEVEETGTLPDGFTVYETFDDIHINEKPFLRRLAIIQGRIDALRFLLDSKTPPGECEWLSDNPETLRQNIEQELTDLCTERGGVGSTRTVYLRGWVQAVNYALERTTTPSSRV